MFFRNLLISMPREPKATVLTGISPHMGVRWGSTKRKAIESPLWLRNKKAMGLKVTHGSVSQQWESYGWPLSKQK
jgi:hypothetical protein